MGKPFEQRIDVIKRFEIGLAAQVAAGFGLLHQSRVFQHLDVFRHGRKRHVKRFGKFCNVALSLGEPIQNRAPGSVGKCMKNAIELFF